MLEYLLHVLEDIPCSCLYIFVVREMFIHTAVCRGDGGGVSWTTAFGITRSAFHVDSSTCKVIPCRPTDCAVKLQNICDVAHHEVFHVSNQSSGTGFNWFYPHLMCTS